MKILRFLPILLISLIIGAEITAQIPTGSSTDDGQNRCTICRYPFATIADRPISTCGHAINAHADCLRGFPEAIRCLECQTKIPTTCNICRDPFSSTAMQPRASRLYCSHNLSLHAACLDQWLTIQLTCPICREAAKPTSEAAGHMLVCAAFDNNLDSVIKLLAIPRINVNTINEIGDTALDYAIMYRNADMIRVLCSRFDIIVSHNDTTGTMAGLIRAIMRINITHVRLFLKSPILLDTKFNDIFGILDYDIRYVTKTCSAKWVIIKLLLMKKNFLIWYNAN